MVHQKVQIARILPPSSVQQRLKPRPFTHNAQLLLTSPTTQRPQLPFLHPSSTGADPSYPIRILARLPFQRQLSQLLTTERKDYLKYSIKEGVRYGAYLWAFAILIAITIQGINSERLERLYPTPPEWSLRSRHKYRAACGNENPEENPNGDVDYANQGLRYRSLLARLENPKIDGADLRPVLEDDRFYVKDVGRTVFDISAKSEAWREGYYGCMMGAGHAAERLDGWVLDVTRDIAFPGEVVIGPSNPRPKKIRTGTAAPAPKEEDCIPCFEDPGTFYLKILKTEKFTSRQRLQAALAYADWLDYKGLSSAAKHLYDFALQIAVKGLPAGAGDVVDMRTGVIRDGADQVSSNILLATTALGRQQAQANNLSAALPIFLSVLRARRRLSPDLASQLEETRPTAPWSLIETIRSWVKTPPYPSIASSGNEPQLRTPASICEEAGIMVHIGEIFFASSLTPSATEPVSSNLLPSSSSSSSSSSYLSKAASSFFSFFSPSPSQPNPITNPQKSGLRWTHDALDLAEKTLRSTPTSDKGARNKCAECLDAGMENWSKMVSRKLREAHTARMMLARQQQQQNSETKQGPGPGQGQGGNWVWKGAGGDSGLGGVDTVGFGLGLAPVAESKNQNKPGSRDTNNESESESKDSERIKQVNEKEEREGREGEREEGEVDEEEEEWNQEAVRLQSETRRLTRVLKEEGLLLEPWAGRNREPGLMNR